MRKIVLLMSFASVGVLPGFAAAAPPLAGCYERVYDAAHLAQHKGQIVARITLSVSAAAPEMATDKTHPIVANGDLKLWVRGISKSFDSLGACETSGEGLDCAGSLSAAEAPQCKSKEDGLRQCRIDMNDSGSFRIEGKPDGALLTITKRLELLHAPYDGGPYLYLSPENAENGVFLLKRIAGKSGTPCAP
jgi:hypothetical protein